MPKNDRMFKKLSCYKLEKNVILKVPRLRDCLSLIDVKIFSFPLLLVVENRRIK